MQFWKKLLRISPKTFMKRVQNYPALMACRGLFSKKCEKPCDQRWTEAVGVQKRKD